MIALDTFFNYIAVVIGGLLPIANPFSTAPLFISLTKHLTAEEQVRQADLACVYMAIILMAFLFFGALILGFFGITIPGIRIAGGLVILYIGFGMLFPNEKQLPDDVIENAKQEINFAFTPLTMPMLSGPGAIAVILGFSAPIGLVPDIKGQIWGFVIAAIGILVTALICWLVLRVSRKIVP